MQPAESVRNSKQNRGIRRGRLVVGLLAGAAFHHYDARRFERSGCTATNERTNERRGPMRSAGIVLTTLARTAELLYCLLFRSGRISKDRLAVRTKGVDKSLLNSQRGRQLKAFVDGSVLASGDCGFAVYYGEGHPLNCSFRIDTRGERTESGLAELAALFWTLMHHPRGQQLSIFSDSMHALNVVQSVCEEEAQLQSQPEQQPSKKQAKRGGGGRRCPTLDVREARLAMCIWWLLRLRTAQTAFYKVPAHKGFKQNAVADALAQRAAADEGALCEDVPLRASWLDTMRLLLSYLLSQMPQDGGLAVPSPGGGATADGAADAAATRAAARRALVRRPQPLSDSKAVTHVLALDCEMVGVGAFGADSRLASVAITNDQGQQVYFSYAKPTRPVSDYRYKWSGIKPEHLRDAPSFARVQKEVKELISGHVICGHGLENDFGALGFSVPRHMCRDTAHDVRRLLSRAGRPRKLRHITWEFLGLVIQDSDAGHDPFEDALAALLLYVRFQPEFEARAQQKLKDFEAKQVALAERKAARLKAE